MYVVNLQRRQDRKENIINLFQENGIKNYEFFEAVDGKTLEGTNETYNLFIGNDFYWRKNVIGCALSHYTLWKNLLKDDKDMYCIFEDDISLSKNFNKYMNKCRDFMSKNKEIDVLFLGYHMLKNIRPSYTDVYDVEKDIIFAPYRDDLYIGGFFSYIISRSGAKKLNEYILKNGIKHGIDYLIKINKELIVYECRPFIVQSDWVDTPHSNVDSDIQKDFDIMKFSPSVMYETVEHGDRKYKFYKGLDSMGGDTKCIGKRSFSELAQEAANDPQCQAFNTLGFFKSHITNLSNSPWFSNEDGIYVKIKDKIRVKMMCNWCTSPQLCREWNHMTKKNNFIWNNIEITSSDEDIDYYVIINQPSGNDFFIPEKTIVFQMEPWCFSNEQNWGVKTWGDWASPDENKFFHVRSHKNYINVAMWQLSTTYSQFKEEKIVKNEKYGNIISSIVSSKYFDPGHKKRIDFLKFIENKNDPIVQVHIYSKDNVHNFKNYRGGAPDNNKDIGIKPYKYYFMCENNAEYNYITEKLYEPLLTESLCFYWGCPNVTDYIDPLSFVSLDMDDFEKSFNIIKNSLLNNLWEERVKIIRKEKEKVLEYYSFFPTLERIIQK